MAVAITKLVNSKQLSLDHTLASYMPELENSIEHAQDITLRMMVQHRSGIPNFTDNIKFWQDPPEHKRSALEYAIELPVSFKPDKGYEYSNTNYLLLRKIIERTIGYSHHKFIKETILEPLGLKNTFGSLKEVDVENVMSGYYVGVEEDFKFHDVGMLASAQDVGLFLRALNDGSVFNGEEAEIYASIYVYEHGGLVPGYQSLAEYHEDIDTVVVQVINTTDFNGYEWNLSEIFINRIVDILREQP